MSDDSALPSERSLQGLGGRWEGKRLSKTVWPGICFQAENLKSLGLAVKYEPK